MWRLRYVALRYVATSLGLCDIFWEVLSAVYQSLSSEYQCGGLGQLFWQLPKGRIGSLWQLLRQGESTAAAAVGLIESVHAKPWLDHNVAVFELVLAARALLQLSWLGCRHDVIADNSALKSVTVAAAAVTAAVTVAVPAVTVAAAAITVFIVVCFAGCVPL